MSEELKEPEWLGRCDTCGWPIHQNRASGCHEFDCSERPQPKQGQALTHLDRLYTRNYIRQLETKLQLGSTEVTELKTKLRDTTRSREELVIKADAIFDKNTALLAEGRFMREALELLSVGISPWMRDEKIPKNSWQIMSRFAQKALNSVSGRQDSTKGPNSEQDCRAVEHGETAVDDVGPCAAGPAMTASAAEVPGRNLPSRGTTADSKQSRAPDNTNLIGPGCHEIPLTDKDKEILDKALRASVDFIDPDEKGQ